MEQKTLKQMKGSKVHKIVAAVLEVMEKAGFETQMDVKLQETDDAGKWKMGFEKKNTDLNELNSIQRELGNNFAVFISPRNQTTILISIEAPTDDFIALIQSKEQPT